MADNCCNNCMYFYGQSFTKPNGECQLGYMLSQANYNPMSQKVAPVRTPQGRKYKGPVCPNYCRSVGGQGGAGGVGGGQEATGTNPVESSISIIKVIPAALLLFVVLFAADSCFGWGLFSSAGESAKPAESAQQVTQADRQQLSSASASTSIAAATPSGSALDKISASSVRGSYGYSGGSSASDAAAGGHFSEFMVNNYDKSAATIQIKFGWCDKGSSSPNISGDLTGRYVNDSDLGDFSVFRSEGEKTNANGTVKTTAEFRVYPDASKISIANMQVVATDPSGKEIYRMSIGTYDMVKK